MVVDSSVVKLYLSAIKEAVDFYYYDIVRLNGSVAFDADGEFANAYDGLRGLSFDDLCTYLRSNLQFSPSDDFDGFVDMALEDFSTVAFKKALGVSGILEQLPEISSEDDIDELVFDEENRHYDHQRELFYDACCYASQRQDEVFERVVNGLAKMLISKG